MIIVIRNLKPLLGRSLPILKPWLFMVGKGIKSSVWLMVAFFLLGRSPVYASSTKSANRSPGSTIATIAIVFDSPTLAQRSPRLPFSTLSATIAYTTRHTCPADTKALSQQLVKDLYGYLTRTYTRLGFKTQVQIVANPELEPLPLAAGSRVGIEQLKSPDVTNWRDIEAETGVEQVFISLTTREAGQTETTEQAYWLFMTETSKGWRLAMVYTRVGNAPAYDVSDGAIADAVKTWLRDRCY
jgi:hypothetical protein